MWSWAWMRNAAEQGQHEACCACCVGTLAGCPQQREAPRRRDHNGINSSMHAVLGGGAGHQQWRRRPRQWRERRPAGGAANSTSGSMRSKP